MLKVIRFQHKVSSKAWSIASLEPHSPKIRNSKLQACNRIQRVDERKNRLAINTHNWKSFPKAGVSKVSFTSITRCMYNVSNLKMLSEGGSKANEIYQQCILFINRMCVCVCARFGRKSPNTQFYTVDYVIVVKVYTKPAVWNSPPDSQLIPSSLIHSELTLTWNRALFDDNAV